MQKNLFRRIRSAAYIASLLALVGMFAPVGSVERAVGRLVPVLQAQTFTHNTTTLAAAQSASDTTLSLTAVSAASGSSFGAVQAGQLVLVDAELETFVSATATSTIWNVQRRGRLTSHASGTPVYIGSSGSFQSADPPPGTCVVASQPRWWINVITPSPGGNQASIFTCQTSGNWAKSNVPWYAGLESGNGATRTLTAAQSGQTFLFDRAAGIVYTLPPPFPGMTFDFVYTVTITSNAATVVTAAGTQFVAGALRILVSGAVTGLDFQCNGTSHIKITSNGTTSGGILGGHVRFVAASSTLWVVDGLLVGSGSNVTPCST